jgi:hypothetical protein
MEMICTKCGEIYKDFENHSCDPPGRTLDKLQSKAPMIGKIIAGVGALGLSAALLPASAMMLIFSGTLVGSVWILMILKPLGETALDWLARHPKTFLLLHVPMTVGFAMLGEGLILAFGNLVGGVLATVWLVNWGRKRGIAPSGRPIPGAYVPPVKHENSKWNRFKNAFWEIAVEDI